MIHIDCGLCTVRSWRPGDEDSLTQSANNRKIWQTMRDLFPHPYTRDDARWWIDLASREQPETKWAVDVAGEAVGGIGIVLHNDIERCSAEIGYWLSEAFWGRGIMTAALRGATDYSFAQFPLTRLYAMPFTPNRASARILEKAGYQLEGTLRKSAIKEGIVRDQWLYACVR